MTPPRRIYVAATLLLFAVEVLIASFVHDAVIRPYAGDSIVVILVYTFLRSTTRLGASAAVVGAFLLACTVELGQYIHLVDQIGLGRNGFARTVLGTQFEPADFLAYAIGALVVLAGERAWRQWAPSLQ
jgi:hypothetical protein